MNLSPIKVRSICGRFGAGGAGAEAIEAHDPEPRGFRGVRREGRLESAASRGGLDADERDDRNEGLQRESSNNP